MAMRMRRTQTREMDINRLYVANPCFRFTYFPFDAPKNEVDFALLYDDRMSSADIDALCAKIKAELQLSHFSWCYACGRCVMSISKADLTRVHAIVGAIVASGRRVYMQDGTQVTWEVGSVVNREEQEKRLLQSIEELLHSLSCAPNRTQRNRYELLSQLIKLPLHRDCFWSSVEGKRMAHDYRQTMRLEDALDRDNMSIGEYFGEVANAPKRAIVNDVPPMIAPQIDVVRQEENKSQPCVICLDKEANTMVLPCEHCVVCKDCSDKLKTDRLNARQCVVCRGRINAVLD